MIGTPVGAPPELCQEITPGKSSQCSNCLELPYTLEDFPSLKEDNNLCELAVSLSDAPCGIIIMYMP